MESCLNPVQQLPRTPHPITELGPSAFQAWFCVRTHPKHEHIAAAQLRQQADVEVFLPRIRYRRPTRFGPAWVTEALFKDYLFAKFDLATSLRKVQNARAVRGVVHFGHRWPAVPDSIVGELQAAMGAQELRTVDSNPRPGDVVEIAAGAMSGLQAVVTRVMPAKQRVAVLLEFLGRQTALELDRSVLAFVSEEESQRVRVPVWESSAELAQAAG